MRSGCSLGVVWPGISVGLSLALAAAGLAVASTAFGSPLQTTDAPNAPKLDPAPKGDTSKLTKEEQQYLQSLAKDTWHCIRGMVNEDTWLPYDNSDHAEYTSVSNIGVFMTSLLSARSLGLLSDPEARALLDKTLKSLEKLHTWYGFAQSWNSVKTLENAKHDPWVSLLDSGNLTASLIAVMELEPSLKVRCKKLLDAMDWAHFYDANQNALIGGYNTEKKEVNPKWHLAMVGTDGLLAQFFAMASGKVPVDFWNGLDRTTETMEGVTYLKPGMSGGGLFMQCISGLWLDNNGTLQGRSAANFTYAQIQHAKKLGSPVWGWSACDNPAGGYLGWGGLKDEVVTPHASGLALAYYPHEAVANLKALEKLGARSEADGFYDSLDWKTSKHSHLFLNLDQGMMLISIANTLRHDVIRTAFEKNALVQEGRKRIPEYAAASKPKH